MDARPIGVFDSGLGGVSVLASLEKKLPNESFIYYGDTARCPYGNKTRNTIIRYAKEIVNSLLTEENIKCIVVACNTASAYALEILQDTYEIPIIGVIIPTVEGIVDSTMSDLKSKITLLATSSTIQSEVYQDLLTNAGVSEEQLNVMACPLLVPLVEEGMFLEDHMSSKEYYQGDFILSWRKKNQSLNRYLQTKPRWNIVYQTMNYYLGDILSMPNIQNTRNIVLLGCTHYPYLLNLFKMFYGDDNILWMQSADFTADYVQKVLSEKGLLFEGHPQETKFYFSDYFKVRREQSSTGLKTKHVFQIAHMLDILEKKVQVTNIFDRTVLPL